MNKTPLFADLTIERLMSFEQVSLQSDDTNSKKNSNSHETEKSDLIKSRDSETVVDISPDSEDFCEGDRVLLRIPSETRQKDVAEPFVRWSPEDGEDGKFQLTENALSPETKAKSENKCRWLTGQVELQYFVGKDQAGQIMKLKESADGSIRYYAVRFDGFAFEDLLFDLPGMNLTRWQVPKFDHDNGAYSDTPAYVPQIWHEKLVWPLVAADLTTKHVNSPNLNHGDFDVELLPMQGEWGGFGKTVLIVPDKDSTDLGKNENLGNWNRETHLTGLGIDDKDIRRGTS